MQSHDVAVLRTEDDVMFYLRLTNKLLSGLTRLSNDIVFYFYLGCKNPFDRFLKCIDRLFIYFWTNDVII